MEQSETEKIMPATHTESPSRRVEPLPFRPMVGRDQLHSPMTARSDIPNMAVDYRESGLVSDPEVRIRDLEDENLYLRKEGFSKDREIRMLKSKLLCRKGNTGSFETGMKRPRCDEDDSLMSFQDREQ